MTTNSRQHSAASVKLLIPFYRQASQFTCGPACLMMAMKFFQPSLHLNRKFEFDIWREANLVESYGTSKEGLALAAARRGFNLYILGRTLRHSFVDAIDNKIPNIDYKMLELLYNDTKAKLHAMRVKNAAREVRLSNLKRALRNSHVPILLTSTSLFGEKEDLPHWVVVTGYGEEIWYINNPLANSPNTRLDGRTLENNLWYKEVRCAVIVQGLRR
ncbi:MAG: peptidase C39 family protein [Candidatus Bathyarchaeia archaeon]